MDHRDYRDLPTPVEQAVYLCEHPTGTLITPHEAQRLRDAAVREIGFEDLRQRHLIACLRNGTPMSDQIGHNKPCYVYRLYGRFGDLLYVGSTTDVKRRMAEHRISKSWARREVFRIEVEEYSSRWRAALAERAAGRGTYGQLRGGIGKGMAAVMTDEELLEALAHPVYDRMGDEEISHRWGMRVTKVRELRARLGQVGSESEAGFARRAGVDRQAVRGWLGRRRRTAQD